MEYEVIISTPAQNDINDTLYYIDNVLKNPAIADNLVFEIEKTITFLQSSPTTFKVESDKVLKSWKIRHLQINNYLMFYTIKENTVIIIRYLYAKRNWEKLFKAEIDN